MIHDLDRLPHKPYYYQVGQIPVLRTDDEIKEKGKETRSNILAPGTEAEIRTNDETGPDGTPKLRANEEGWCTIGASLGLKNQHFDAWGAHFTFTSGSWTGHHYSGRREGDRVYGQGLLVSGYSSAGGGRVQVGYAGGTVSITAEGEGLSASTSVTVGSDPRWAAEVARRVEADKAQLAKYMSEKPKDVNDALARLKGAEWILTRKPEKPNDYREVSGWASAMRTYILSRAYCRERSEYEYPKRQNMCTDHVTSVTGDWRGAIQCAAEYIAIERIRCDIETERNNALEAVNNALAACTDLAPAAKGSIESGKREVEMFRQSTQRLLKGCQVSGYDRMAKAAFNAGDAGAYEQARTQQIQLLCDPEDKRDLAILYGAMAEDLVTLTGDRAKGADLWNQAKKVHLEAQPQDAKSLTQWYEQNTPVWWPEGRRQ